MERLGGLLLRKADAFQRQTRAAREGGGDVDAVSSMKATLLTWKGTEGPSLGKT